MDGVSRDEFSGRKELCDERFRRDNKRLEILETSMQTLTNLVTQLTEIVNASVTSNVDQEKRLREVEHRGGKRWDALVGQIVSILIAAGMGLLLGKTV